MIDKALPFYPITMYKTDTKTYPKYELPKGYSFVFYQKSDEEKWASIEYSLGQFESIEDGIKCFNNEFLIGQELVPEQRVMFVKDEDGEYVATASLWDGMFLNNKRQRVHWVAVSDKCVGKGIAKALISRILDLYNSLGYDGFIYLLTGTWYYSAIGIYKKFGFTEYTGKQSLSPNLTDVEFDEQNKKAISLVQQKLSDYAKLKKGKEEE